MKDPKVIREKDICPKFWYGADFKLSTKLSEIYQNQWAS